MEERIIETLIKKANEKESNAHGSNKKCFLIDDYALLQQMFTVDEITKIMEITEKLEKNGISVARTLDYQVNKQEVRDWNTDKNVQVSEGYVLQQRAKGNPLLDRTNWSDKDKRYQIDYLNQITMISKESQIFFNQFIRDWIEISNNGMRIDPSKPGNFIYDENKGITFIDLGLSEKEVDMSMTLYEQLAVILNLNAYNKCYPEIQQVIDNKLGIIINKYREAAIQQGIDEDTIQQVIQDKIPSTIIEHAEKKEEIIEDNVEYLQNIIDGHIKEEQLKKEELRRKAAEEKETQRIKKEKEEAEKKKAEDEEERKNGPRRQDSKVYVILNDLIKNEVIPEDEAKIYQKTFQRKMNIYADLNPELFRKYNGVPVSVSDVLNLSDENIQINIREMQLVSSNGEISPERYNYIRNSVDAYLKDYFEDMAKQMDSKLLEYSQMKERKEAGLLNEEECVEFSLLETELYEFSGGNELFSILGIEDRTIFEGVAKVSQFMEQKNASSEQEKKDADMRRRQNDRDYLYEALQGIGTTDIAQLRKIYEGQNEIKVSDEDLDIVLQMISNNEQTEIFSEQEIGKATISVPVEQKDKAKQIEEFNRDKKEIIK